MKPDLAQIILRDAGGIRKAEKDPTFYDIKRLLRRVYPRCMIQVLPLAVTIISPDGEILRIKEA